MRFIPVALVVFTAACSGAARSPAGTTPGGGRAGACMTNGEQDGSWVSSGGGITKARALDIARAAIASRSSVEMVITEKGIEERDFGWVFPSVPRRYVETGDPNQLIPGPGPVVVERSGCVHHLGSWPGAVDDFERRWRGR